MPERQIMDGSLAAALSAKLSRAEVVAAYPITPQTHIVEYIADFIANGELKAEFINVESEHSAISAVLGASLAGARTFTATAGQGLALMHEILHWTATSRAPIVMAVCNRALAPPWNIWNDQQDSISQRDTGWMQVFCENAQEVMDTIIQAYKIAEDERVSLPIMVTQDGFLISHTREPVLVPKQRDVDDFLPPYNPKITISDPEHPYVQNSYAVSDWYQEFKYAQTAAMDRARKVIKKVTEDFIDKFGRCYGIMTDTYKMEGADAAVLTLGAHVGIAKEAIDRARERGKNVGLIKLRFFRPFPIDEIKKIGEEVDAIATVEKDFSFGYAGAIFTEVRSALYDTKRKPKVIGFSGGFGGREITIEDFEAIIDEVLKVAKTGAIEKPYDWIRLKTRGG